MNPLFILQWNDQKYDIAELRDGVLKIYPQIWSHLRWTRCESLDDIVQISDIEYKKIKKVPLRFSDLR